MLIIIIRRDKGVPRRNLVCVAIVRQGITKGWKELTVSKTIGLQSDLPADIC